MKLRYRIGLLVLIPLLLLSAYQFNVYRTIFNDMEMQRQTGVMTLQELDDGVELRYLTLNTMNSMDNAIVALLAGDKEGAKIWIRKSEEFRALRDAALAKSEKDMAQFTFNPEEQENETGQLLEIRQKIDDTEKATAALDSNVLSAQNEEDLIRIVEIKNTQVNLLEENLLSSINELVADRFNEVAQSREMLRTSQEQGSKSVYIVLITTFIVFLLIIMFLDALITKPITSMSESVDQITKGNFDIRLESSFISEIQALTTAINRVLASMKLAILRAGLTKEEIGIGEALQAKKEAEDMYKILYEHSSDAIMTIEPPDWKFTAGNPATLRMFNLESEQELKTLTPNELSPKYQPNGKLSAEAARDNIEKAMREGSSYFEWTHKKYDGEDFSATVLLTRVEIGGKKFLQATVRDISSQKWEEEEYRALFNSITDSVFIHDMNAHFLEINDAACRRLGYTREELLRLGPQKIDSPKFAKMVPARIKELKEKGRAVFESAHITKDGKEIPVEISSTVITYAGKPAILSVARDISDRKTRR